MPRESKDNMEEKVKTHSFITKDIKTAVYTMLDWLCCKKKRNSEKETTDVAMGEKADSSDLANDKANYDLKIPKMEEPWIKKYYQTATYHPGQFSSDTEDDDD